MNKRAKILATILAFCAVLELLEMGRWITIAATATWDYWYLAEYTAVILGITGVLWGLNMYLRREA